MTGATGFIGGHVARQLLARGDDVVALVRDPRRAGALEDLGATLVQGDITDEASLRMEDCDAVMHLAAWYDVGKRNPQAALVNVEGTRNVLRQMFHAGLPGVYVSTVAVHSDTRGVAVDESHVHQGRFLSLYDETKWRAHHEVAVPAIADGLELVIAQPGVVYGPGDHSPMGDVLRAYLARSLPVVPRDAAHCWAHVEDTAAGLIACLDRGRAGQAYHLAGPTHRLADVLAMAQEITGIPAPRQVGRVLLRTAAALLRIPDLVFDLPKTYDPETLRVAPATYLADASKARDELGWDPRPLREGLRDTLAYEQDRLLR